MKNVQPETERARGQAFTIRPGNEMVRVTPKPYANARVSISTE